MRGHRQAGGMSFATPFLHAASGAYVHGMALGLGLIVAIGAQNAFVLRQGLQRAYVGRIVLFCALADAVLMAAGVWGMAQALASVPGLARALALAGAAFLAAYGVNALRRARQPAQGLAEQGMRPAAHGAAVLAQAAAFTLLNPHAYLDTVVLIGSVGAQQPRGLQPWFVAGASTASVLWFAALGYGARWLAPWFARPKAWRVLDGVVGLTMLALAALLLRHAMGAG